MATNDLCTELSKDAKLDANMVRFLGLCCLPARQPSRPSFLRVLLACFPTSACLFSPCNVSSDVLVLFHCLLACGQTTQKTLQAESKANLVTP